ncbi:ATP-binding protein [Alkalihalobacillus sp. MEB130]|uniref:two-component system sensor histidine kinase NtrB n=1 Tax=Alkalihalobacillus sp. MEB130 TaxID=2976704 RepID=UPI0028DEF933|nr:ATP-binding protein [Alkalihalobacillus sp. MEB130]MDT8861959.1 ATP-binding protein [Alkalihalobacillus sp. MEB130]
MVDKDDVNLHAFPSLEEELAFYKRAVAEMPFDIDYIDSTSNMRLVKKKDEKMLTITDANRHSSVDDEKNMVLPHIECQLTEVESFLQPLFDVIPHHIVFINREGNVTLCNKQALKDLNETKERIIGQPISNLLKIDKKDIKLLETLNTGKQLYDQEILDSNYGIINTRILYDEKGNILRVIGIFHFLNHLKEAEKMNMIGQISASIAHEIRNPLTTVRGYLQLIGQDMIPNVPDLFNSLLIPELDRANKIITDFLTVSKASPMKKEPETVKRFVTHFEELLFSESLIKKVELNIALPENLADTLIMVNHNELLQVFVNLFNNAVESREDKDLVITLECRRDQSEVVFLFKDTGRGMNSQTLAHIFDPFFSLKDMGTGLGLSLSKKIIELHSGTISVTSTRHVGTCFTIRLPIYDENVE